MRKSIIAVLFLAIIFTIAIAQIMPAEDTATTAPTFSITASKPTTSIIETVITEPTIPLIEMPQFDDFTYIPNLSKEENVSYRVNISNYIITLFSLLADYDLQAPNYPEACAKICAKIEELQALDRRYLEDYLAIIEAEENAKWVERMEKYPVATKVWLYLTEEMGYSNHAAAGVIGNMMAECGGRTLELKWWVYNSTKHYGLCQWSPKYYPEMQDATLEEQLAFMKESFPKVIQRYGYLYTKGFDYEQFISMDDCGEAAIAFCKIYERPGGTQEHRRRLAQKAYDYFAN